MNGEKQNPQVKLHFDVMDGETTPEAKTSQAPPSNQPPKAMQDRPKEPVMTDIPEQNEPGGHGLIVKIVAGIVLVVVLGLAGYYGYQWFSNRSADQDTADQAQNVPPEPELPAQWLIQHFGSGQCDADICGPNSDPDGDGLRNLQEVEVSTSPILSDTDNDGITDGDEIAVYNTDPIVADSDGDGYEDGIEIRNGYSPVVASRDPAATIEKQLWEENISKNGLSEGSETFLSLTAYESSFLVSTATPQIYLGYPKDFIVRESYDEGAVQFENPSDELSSVLVSLELLLKNTASSSQEFIDADTKQLEQKYNSAEVKQETLPAGKKQLHLVLLETIEKGDGSVTRQVAYLPVDDMHVYRVMFEAPEKNWQRLELSARAILGGCRVWPF